MFKKVLFIFGAYLLIGSYTMGSMIEFPNVSLLNEDCYINNNWEDANGGPLGEFSSENKLYTKENDIIYAESMQCGMDECRSVGERQLISESDKNYDKVEDMKKILNYVDNISSISSNNGGYVIFQTTDGGECYFSSNIKFFACDEGYKRKSSDDKEYKLYKIHTNGYEYTFEMGELGHEKRIVIKEGKLYTQEILENNDIQMCRIGEMEMKGVISYPVKKEIVKNPYYKILKKLKSKFKSKSEYKALLLRLQKIVEKKSSNETNVDKKEKLELLRKGIISYLDGSY